MEPVEFMDQCCFSSFCEGKNTIDSMAHHLESLKLEINLLEEEKVAYLETLKEEESTISLETQTISSEFECSIYESTKSESSICETSPDDTDDDEDVPDNGWRKFSLDSGFWDSDDLADKRPISYGELTLTKKEADGVLSQRIVATALSHLAQLPDQSKYVFTKLLLPSKGIEDINILEKYKDLMFIDLSCNKIEEMSVFSNMTHLIYLNLRKNKIASMNVEEAKPTYLTFLDISHNLLQEIPDLTSLWSLTHLDLSKNIISHVTGIWSLRHLKILNLSHNYIDKFDVRLFAMNIEHLDISHNKISEWSGDVDDLIVSQTLIQLNISNNQLKTLEQIRRAYWLKELNVSDNCIADVQELNHLSQLKRLDLLIIDGNELWHMTEARGLTIHLAPSLSTINGLSISMTERMNAADLFSNTMMQQAFQVYSWILTKRHLVEPLTFGMDPSLRYRESCKNIVILVGPPGSCKWEIISKLSAKYPSYIRMGKLITTRKTTESHLKHVTVESFNSLIDSGYVITYEFRLGAGYALCWEDLENGIDGQLTLLGMELSAALSLLWQGIKANLILTYTNDNTLHLERLKELCQQNFSNDLEKHLSDYFHTEEESAVTLEERDSTNLDLRDEPGEDSEDLDIILIDKLMRGSDSTLAKFDQIFICPCKMNTVKKNDKENIDQEIKEATWTPNEDAVTPGVTSCAKSDNLESNNNVDSQNSQISELSICMTEEEEEEEEGPDVEYLKNKVFIDSVLRSKDEYLDIHQKMPGLFYTSVRTDNVNQCLKKLTAIVKTLYSEDNNIANKAFLYNPKEDPLYDNIVQESIDSTMKNLSRGHSQPTFLPIVPEKEPFTNKTSFYFNK